MSEVSNDFVFGYRNMISGRIAREIQRYMDENANG